MGQYRTAQGKTIDMSALAAKNERVRAVGNMKANARGDTIDSHGSVVVPVTQKVGEKYQNTVGNKSAQPVKEKLIPDIKPIVSPALTKEEAELDSFSIDDLEVEQIKAKETKK